MSLAIATRGLSRDFGDVRAVVNLDLEVEAGHVFAFLGPNGAGKTTSIRMMLGLQHPSAGHVEVFGLDPAREPEAVHRRVSYLPGDLALFPRLSGRQHLEVISRLRADVDPATMNRLAERFDAPLDRPVHELSTGNRQKIGIIAAFMSRAELIVLDEPTAGLDPLMRNEFLDLVRESVADGRTVFLSSHDLDEVQRVAERVALIRRGSLVAVDAIDALARRLPRQVDVRLDRPVRAEDFASIPNVHVESISASEVRLALTGAAQPLLRALAELAPLDLTWRRADLEELFLEMYHDEGDADAH